jgi:alpha-N-arabinofuranosidase
MRDAILAALNFNIFARHAERVRMANIAQMVNVLQAVILTDGSDMVLTPTYWVHRLYLPMQDATLIPVEFDAGEYRQGDIVLPGVDAVAMRDTAGKLWLSLVNLDPNEGKDVSIGIPGVSVRGVTGEVLTAPEVNSFNTFEAPDTVTPKPIGGTVHDGTVRVTLPSKSVTMIAIEE